MDEYEENRKWIEEKRPYCKSWLLRKLLAFVEWVNEKVWKED